MNTIQVVGLIILLGIIGTVVYQMDQKGYEWGQIFWVVMGILFFVLLCYGMYDGQPYDSGEWTHR